MIYNMTMFGELQFGRPLAFFIFDFFSSGKSTKPWLGRKIKPKSWQTRNLQKQLNIIYYPIR